MTFPSHMADGAGEEGEEQSDHDPKEDQEDDRGLQAVLQRGQIVITPFFGAEEEDQGEDEPGRDGRRQDQCGGDEQTVPDAVPDGSHNGNDGVQDGKDDGEDLGG